MKHHCELSTQILNPISGPLCCLGDGCDLTNCQRDEDNKHDFKKCCPRDENGCLKLGSICIISSPHNGTKDYVVFHDDKAKCDSSFCPHPHASVKPNPMCCVGDHCNKTKCETLQNCCTNGGEDIYFVFVILWYRFRIDTLFVLCV